MAWLKSLLLSLRNGVPKWWNNTQSPSVKKKSVRIQPMCPVTDKEQICCWSASHAQLSLQTGSQHNHSFSLNFKTSKFLNDKRMKNLNQNPVLFLFPCGSTSFGLQSIQQFLLRQVKMKLCLKLWHFVCQQGFCLQHTGLAALCCLGF